MLATMMSHATATATAPCRRDHVASFSFSSSQRYHHHHQWKKNCVQFHHRRRRHRTCNATEIVAGRFPDERTYIMVKCVRASFAPYVSSTSSFFVFVFVIVVVVVVVVVVVLLLPARGEGCSYYFVLLSKERGLFVCVCERERRRNRKKTDRRIVTIYRHILRNTQARWCAKRQSWSDHRTLRE